MIIFTFYICINWIRIKLTNLCCVEHLKFPIFLKSSLFFENSYKLFFESFTEEAVNTERC